MKNPASFKWLLFLPAFVLCLNAEAKWQILTPDSLPFTFSMLDNHQTRFIDVDGNGVADYRITFYHSSTEAYCWIRTPVPPTAPEPFAQGLLSTINLVPINEVLLEDRKYTSFLPHGSSIGLNTPSGTGSLWYMEGCIFTYSYSQGATLGSSSIDEATSGYIGYQFDIDGSDHYGWLYTTINDGGNSVTIGPIGSSPSMGSAILAGSGSSAVPIPIIASILGF
jgi:hypothetical protein